MTIDEIITQLKALKIVMAQEDEDDTSAFSPKTYKAIDKAIASLNALEEIRQEAIDAIEDGLYVRNSRILDIIDKHMGETE